MSSNPQFSRRRHKLFRALAKMAFPLNLNEVVDRVNVFTRDFPELLGEKLVNERLLRHILSNEVVDVPDKEGKELRFEYRHLLQILLTRKFTTERMSQEKRHELMLDKTDARLEEMLTADDPRITPVGSRTSYRSRDGTRQRRLAEDAGGAGYAASDPVWARRPLVPGKVELHYRPGSIDQEFPDKHERLLGEFLETVFDLKFPDDDGESIREMIDWIKRKKRELNAE